MDGQEKAPFDRFEQFNLINLRVGLALIFVLLGSMAARAGEITPTDLGEIEPADVVILGEVHDNLEHHGNQALAVEVWEPKALVFEMLLPSQAENVTTDNRAEMKELEAALGWKGSGWPDFTHYYHIFEAAPGAAVFGGNRARSDVKQAISDGAAAVFGAGATRFGLDAALPDEEQSAREALQMAAHCNALPESLLGGMVEAQRLRDATLVDAILKAHAATGGPVAVITGNGHARRDWGVPSLLAIAASALRVVSIGQFELEAPENPPFDHHIITAEAERDDPCAAFN